MPPGFPLLSSWSFLSSLRLAFPACLVCHSIHLAAALAPPDQCHASSFGVTGGVGSFTAGIITAGTRTMIPSSVSFALYERCCCLRNPRLQSPFGETVISASVISLLRVGFL